MSRRTWQAVIGGGVALLLVAALVVLLLLPEPTTEPDNPDPSTDTVTMDPLIDKATKDNSQAVSAVTVTTAKETFTVKPNAEGIYCVEAYADLPVDESAVDVLLDAVTTITPSSQLKTVADDMTAYGFDSDSTKVSVTYKDGETFAFELGDAAATGTGVYFRKSNDTAVYLMATSFASTFAEPSTYYVGRVLTVTPTLRENDSGTAQMTKLVMTGPDREPLTIRYKRASDPSALTMLCSHLIETPYLAACNYTVLSKWQTAFNALLATEVVYAHPTAAEKKAVGLNAPSLTAKLTLGVVTSSKDADGNTTGTEIYNTTTYTLYFGSTNEDGDYYVQLEGTDVVYLVAASDAPFADVTLDDVIWETLMESKIVDVKRISISAARGDYVFDLTHTDDEDHNLLVSMNGDSEFDAENFRTYYGLLVSLDRYIGVDKNEADAFLKNKPEPVFEVSFEHLDGHVDAATVYTYDVNRSLVVKPDGRMYLVKTAGVETLLRQLDNVVTGKTVAEVA